MDADSSKYLAVLPSILCAETTHYDENGRKKPCVGKEMKARY